MSSREQFEAWMTAEQWFHDSDFEWDERRNCYSQFGIHLAYKSWQAATNAMEAKCAALAAESEDRRQFILNGVEMGFIRLPDEDTKDPAKSTYDRCLSGTQSAPCPKCNDTGMMDSGGTQPWGEPIEIECDCRHQDANTAELVAAGIITRIEG